jgi:hypothetical protein
VLRGFQGVGDEATHDLQLAHENERSFANGPINAESLKEAFGERVIPRVTRVSAAGPIETAFGDENVHECAGEKQCDDDVPDREEGESVLGSHHPADDQFEFRNKILKTVCRWGASKDPAWATVMRHFRQRANK